MPEYQNNVIDNVVSKPVCGPQTVHFQTHPREALARSGWDPCLGNRKPEKGAHTQEDFMNWALYYSYRTQYRKEYGPNSGIPYTRRPPPRTHEPRPDQVSWNRRKFNPPFQEVTLNKGTHANDSDRGYHEWRQLMPGPGDFIWKPLERNIFWRNTGKSQALPPARVNPHNSNLEKQRWQNIKILDNANCLSYGFRRNVPGYMGHVQMVEQLDSKVAKEAMGDNKAMESTAQASYREHPGDLYAHHGEDENANKHKGPLSRMVTLTHPFNPFTQQSAYSNMGATQTTGSR